MITFPETVDAALQTTIYDWFQFREVCDDEKFPAFFLRELNKDLRKYNELLRIQPGQSIVFPDGRTRTVTYDWMVQNYRELREQGTLTGSKSETTSKAGSGEIEENTERSVTGTGTTGDQIAKNVTRNDTGSGSSSGSSESSGENSSSSDSNKKSLGKGNPQSISYSGNGFPDSLNWQYPGQQGETKGSESSTGSSSEETEQRDEWSQTGQATTAETTSKNGNSSKSETDESTKTTSNNVTEQGTLTGSDNQTTDKKVIEAGRGLDPATILQNAVDFILNSEAWDFLYKRLDTCFMGLYDY